MIKIGPLVLALLFALACSAPPAPASTVQSLQDAASYGVKRCAGGTGATMFMAIHCEGSDTLLDATCDVSGGEVETSEAYGENGWACTSSWHDTRAGGSMCIALVCAPQ